MSAKIMTNVYYFVNVNPWHDDSGEPRPTDLVAVMRQYRGPRG